MLQFANYWPACLARCHLCRVAVTPFSCHPLHLCRVAVNPFSCHPLHLCRVAVTPFSFGVWLCQWAWLIRVLAQALHNSRRKYVGAR